MKATGENFKRSLDVDCDDSEEVGRKCKGKRKRTNIKKNMITLYVPFFSSDSIKCTNFKSLTLPLAQHHTHLLLRSCFQH